MRTSKRRLTQQLRINHAKAGTSEHLIGEMKRSNR
jgi:hypothetical protein